MGWHKVVPMGAISVRANRPYFQDNLEYTQTYLGDSLVGDNTGAERDHFWNVDADHDGHHRFMKSFGFTVGGNPADPELGSSECVEYFKLSQGRVQGFFRNNDIIYQHIPGFKSGSLVINDSYIMVTDVPANCYGEIIFWTNELGNESAQTGFFRSTGTTVEGWSVYLSPHAQGSTLVLKLGNGSQALGLNLRVRINDTLTGYNWNWRLTYRAI